MTIEVKKPMKPHPKKCRCVRCIYLDTEPLRKK